MTTSNTHQLVNVEFTYTKTEDVDYNIDLVDYRDWLEIGPDEDFEFIPHEVKDYLESFTTQQITMYCGYLPDFEIEKVNFIDCE